MNDALVQSHAISRWVSNQPWHGPEFDPAPPIVPFDAPARSFAHHFPTVPVDEPLQAHLERGRVPRDGKSFFNALIHLDQDSVDDPSMSADSVCRKIATTAVHHMLECLHRGPDARALLQHPHLQHMLQDPWEGRDITFPELERVIGTEAASRCDVMTAAQRVHVFHLANAVSRPEVVGPGVAGAACAAFPGLRLAVIGPDTTRRNIDAQTYGVGDAEPEILYLSMRRDGRPHFDPAWIPDPVDSIDRPLARMALGERPFA